MSAFAIHPNCSPSSHPIQICGMCCGEEASATSLPERR